MARKVQQSIRPSTTLKKCLVPIGQRCSAVIPPTSGLSGPGHPVIGSPENRPIPTCSSIARRISASVLQSRQGSCDPTPGRQRGHLTAQIRHDRTRTLQRSLAKRAVSGPTKAHKHAENKDASNTRTKPPVQPHAEFSAVHHNRRNQAERNSMAASRSSGSQNRTSGSVIGGFGRAEHSSLTCPSSEPEGVVASSCTHSPWSCLGSDGSLVALARDFGKAWRFQSTSFCAAAENSSGFAQIVESASVS